MQYLTNAGCLVVMSLVIRSSLRWVTVLVLGLCGIRKATRADVAKVLVATAELLRKQGDGHQRR